MGALLQTPPSDYPFPTRDRGVCVLRSMICEFPRQSGSPKISVTNIVERVPDLVDGKVFWAFDNATLLVAKMIAANI
jgi:hypothetical protein